MFKTLDGPDPFHDHDIDRCGWIANRLIEDVNLAGKGKIVNRAGAVVHDGGKSGLLVYWFVGLLERDAAGVDPFLKIAWNIIERQV